MTSKGKLTDKRYNNYWNRLTENGKVVFLILLAILVVLAFQELNTQSINKTSKEKLKSEQHIRDSLITIGITQGVDSSRKKLFKDISNAFLLQEFKLDTLKKEIIRIRDSARTITNNFIQKNDPILLVDSLGIKPLRINANVMEYSMSFRSSGAASTNFNILCYIILQFEEKTYEVSIWDIFYSDIQIPKNDLMSSNFNIKKDPEPPLIYFYLVGTYSNIDKTKTYSINTVYVFDMKTNIVRTLIGKKRQSIIGVVKDFSKDVKP